MFPPTLPGAIGSIRAAKSKHVSALSYFQCNNLGIFSPLMFLVVTKHIFFYLVCNYPSGWVKVWLQKWSCVCVCTCTHAYAHTSLHVYGGTCMLFGTAVV